jgi:hypothetical protein
MRRRLGDALAKVTESMKYSNRPNRRGTRRSRNSAIYFSKSPIATNRILGERIQRENGEFANRLSARLIQHLGEKLPPKLLTRALLLSLPLFVSFL